MNLHDLNCSLDLIFELTFHNISGLICYQVGSVIEWCKALCDRWNGVRVSKPDMLLEDQHEIQTDRISFLQIYTTVQKVVGKFFCVFLKEISYAHQVFLF